MYCAFALSNQWVQNWRYCHCSNCRQTSWNLVFKVTFLCQSQPYLPSTFRKRLSFETEKHHSTSIHFVARVVQAAHLVLLSHCESVVTAITSNVYTTFSIVLRWMPQTSTSGLEQRGTTKILKWEQPIGGLAVTQCLSVLTMYSPQFFWAFSIGRMTEIGLKLSSCLSLNV